MSHVIDSYSFGRISVDGESYSQDLIITPEKILPNWWRREGHSLCLDDLKAILDNPPDTLIIGRGANGVMKPPADTISKLEDMNIKVITVPTGDAVEEYNKRSSKENVVAALHLTC